MELKVWVEGIQRVVCGVSDTTTCQDVVYALAHATGKTGRFTLIERWRNSERLLAPNEYPRKILLKWGEYSSDVQFILQRNSLETRPDSKSDASKASHSSSASESPKSSASNAPRGLQSPQVNRDIKKSLTFSGVHATQLQAQDIFGVEAEVCPPIPPYIPEYVEPPRHPIARPPAPPPYSVARGNPPPPPSRPIRPPDGARVPPPYSVASQLSKIRFHGPPKDLPPYREPPRPPRPSHPSLVKLNGQSHNKIPPPDVSFVNCVKNPSTASQSRNNVGFDCVSSSVMQSPDSFSRNAKDSADDPNPRVSNNKSINGHSNSPQSSRNSGDINDNILNPFSKTVKDLTNLRLSSENMDGAIVKELLKDLINEKGDIGSEFEEVVIDGYYKNLVKLVNVQREKLSSQQIDMTKCEAEISYFEGRCKEQDARLAYIQSEIDKAEKQLCDDPIEEIKMLESALEKAQNNENAMTNELMDLRSKLYDAETKVSHLSEQRLSLENQLSNELSEQKRTVEEQNEQEELAIQREIENLQHSLKQAMDQTQNSEEISDSLSQKITDVENELLEKKSEIENLKEALKEANLEALTMTPSEDIKVSPEGIHRRIKGSPRQLETAVPTSQNPHGVWV